MYHAQIVYLVLTSRQKEDSQPEPRPSLAKEMYELMHHRADLRYIKFLSPRAIQRPQPQNSDIYTPFGRRPAVHVGLTTGVRRRVIAVNRG